MEPQDRRATEGSGPAASVILTAHDRRPFLRDAVESVQAQTVDRSAYELVVVKNFLDAEIDSFLDRAGAQRVLCEDRPVSRKVLEGLRACRGNVVLLLDDDDLFEPQKIRTVLAEFAARPDLGFYHNQVSYVGADGGPIDPKRSRFLALRPTGRARRLLISNEEKTRGLGRLAYSYPDFNCSSIAIRRDVALASSPYLERIDGGVDTFFFFVALTQPCSLFFDDAALTRYRVHEENASLAVGSRPETRRARLLEAARRQDHVNRVTREMVLCSGSPYALRELEARSLIDRLSIIFRDRESRRLDAVRTLLKGLRLTDTFAVRENVPSMAGALLFAVAPPLARVAYEYQTAIR